MEPAPLPLHRSPIALTHLAATCFVNSVVAASLTVGGYSGCRGGRGGEGVSAEGEGHAIQECGGGEGAYRGCRGGGE